MLPLKMNIYRFPQYRPHEPLHRLKVEDKPVVIKLYKREKSKNQNLGQLLKQLQRMLPRIRVGKALKEINTSCKDTFHGMPENNGWKRSYYLWNLWAITTQNIPIYTGVWPVASWKFVRRKDHVHTTWTGRDNIPVLIHANTMQWGNGIRCQSFYSRSLAIYSTDIVGFDRARVKGRTWPAEAIIIDINSRQKRDTSRL